MPSLRFTRDKRGYETTSLVHAGRRDGRSRQRILYWFRTPPGVRVGRPALDQDAIRWIEENNPDIEFDWPKILEAQPPAAPAKEPGKQRDDARNRGRRRDRPRSPLPSPIQPAASKEPAQPDAEPLEQERELEPELELEPEPLVRAFEQLTHPETEEQIDPPSMPIEQTLDREQLTRLRARYAELLARIAERGGDPQRIEALRDQAESLNPDTWVTDEEVRQGIEAFEPKIRDFRAALGLRRRRRSRRGGRRRREGNERPDNPVPPEPEKGEG